LREKHPELWNELRILSKEENLISKNFCYNYTFNQMEARMDAINAQGRIF
jgi:hypothetical protein